MELENMNKIKIVDYQLGYSETPMSGTQVFINDENILDIENDFDNRIEIIQSILKHFNIDAEIEINVNID